MKRRFGVGLIFFAALAGTTPTDRWCDKERQGAQARRRRSKSR